MLDTSTSPQHSVVHVVAEHKYTGNAICSCTMQLAGAAAKLCSGDAPLLPVSCSLLTCPFLSDLCVSIDMFACEPHNSSAGTGFVIHIQRHAGPAVSCSGQQA